MRARGLLMWILGAILITSGHRTRNTVSSIRRLVHMRKHPKIYREPDAELPTRKSMLFDVVNKQDLQTGIYDSMGRVPWKNYNSGKEKGAEGDIQLPSEEMTELFKKLYNDVKINGREISALRTQNVIQTDSNSLSSIEPLSKTDGVVHVNDKGRNMNSVSTNITPLQSAQPRTSFLSVESPIASHASTNPALGAQSILQMRDEGAADNPTKSFQEVAEMIKDDKNNNPIAVQLPLGQTEDTGTEDTGTVQQQSLEQKTNVQDVTARINQQSSEPQIMELPEKILGRQASMQQNTAEQTPSLADSLNPTELGDNVNIAQQESLYPVQDQLISATGNAGADKEILQGIGTLQDRAVTGAQEVAQEGPESRNVDFLFNAEYGSNKEASPYLDWAPNTGHTQDALKNVFSAIDGVTQVGGFSDVVANPYSRGSLYKGGHHLLRPYHKKVDMSHFPKHRENGKPKRKPHHETRTHKNSTKKMQLST